MRDSLDKPQRDYADGVHSRTAPRNAGEVDETDGGHDQQRQAGHDGI